MKGQVTTSIVFDNGIQDVYFGNGLNIYLKEAEYREQAKQAITCHTQAVKMLNQHQVLSSCFPPKHPDHQSIPPDQRLATFAT